MWVALQALLAETHRVVRGHDRGQGQGQGQDPAAHHGLTGLSVALISSGYHYRIHHEDEDDDPALALGVLVATAQHALADAICETTRRGSGTSGT